MVRRAAGVSLGTFFQDEIAKPLGLDFWIGLPEAIEPRVAPIIPFIYKPEQARTPFMIDLATKKESPASLFFFNVGAWRTGGANTRAGRAAEIGAANGVTNARGLAGMYAPLAQRRRQRWSTPRRWRAWARCRWRRTTTPPCASRRALRWAS